MATRLEGHRPPLCGCSNLYRVVLCRFKDPDLYPVCIRSECGRALAGAQEKRRCARYLPAAPLANNAANLTGDDRIDGPPPNRPAPDWRAVATATAPPATATPHGAAVPKACNATQIVRCGGALHLRRPRDDKVNGRVPGHDVVPLPVRGTVGGPARHGISHPIVRPRNLQLQT